MNKYANLLSCISFFIIQTLLWSENWNKVVITGYPKPTIEEIPPTYSHLEIYTKSFPSLNFSNLNDWIIQNKALPQQELIARISDWFQAQGYVLTVSIDKGIKDNELQVQTIVSRYDQILIEQNKQFSSNKLLKNVKAKEGDFIYLPSLRQGNNRMSYHPSIETEYLFEKGSKPASSNVVYIANETKPLTVSQTIENTGTAITGNNRFNTSLTYGNLWGKNHIGQYFFSTSDDLKKSITHYGSYSIYFDQSYLQASITYGTSDPDLGQDLTLDGKSLSTSLSYNFRSPMLFVDYSDWSISLDFKQSNNNLDFGGDDLFDSFTDVAQISASHIQAIPMPFGAVAYTVKATYSPGNLTRYNKDSFHSNSRVDAQADYLYGTLNIDLNFNLPYSFRFQQRFKGQLANHNLIGNEQITAGGQYTVRGYEESEVGGDDGFYLLSDIYLPSQNLNYFDQSFGLIVPNLFFDYAYIKTNDQYGDGSLSKTLLSVGAGFEYYFDNFFSLKVQQAWNLNDTNLNPNNDRKLHFSGSLRY